ncbi:mitochondrial dynamin-like GTPase [Scheffersomyces stipitis CBS 6054]|uniref:dynamin GTPase n=1 Tax=Scheffersomyces stipitis (strain ATCC 58785 / CBS 6054 / NBRC 10063 / NRRL Y-11545) TaxID=322104 RepID=A3GGI6_PICST|nr:mitochondrial dynamin-like GTPase [Scheffersomyces stipitis CBS 6054]EAZ63527.2 mitochondrial dynamin-like GTPase [Scheffersomyces stipitis CBS 6054]
MRHIGFIKILAKTTRIPAYVGGTLAAGGSYVAYKVEQASTYTQDQLSSIKDFTQGVFDTAGDFFKGMGGKSSESGGSSGGSGSPGGSNDTTTAVGATAAALGLTSEDENESEDDENDDLAQDEDEETLYNDYDDDDDLENDETSNEMLNLTRQMIEIRNLLASIDHDGLRLPSIVVIGSQSSGKSSVLEAIVGQEFLPKGSNMVTRRPIELTLINTPEAAADVAEFPALKMHNLTDFEQVQKILLDLNLAVPEKDCISSDPIQITIRSPRVPDLSLVDLPGYIQVEAADQPLELKQKIRKLCDRYLEAPNIILAISAADVDLANSSALRASRTADPRGERTIGVVTKIDLVDPERATKILTNKKYPLRMGYVGVITKAPPTSKGGSGLFSRKAISGYQAYVAQQNFEHSYLKENKEDFYGTTTGTRNLKKKLMKVLEKSMAASLAPTHLAIQQDLEETSYQFKVEFNDRPLTPEMYLANNIDMLKLATKDLSHEFSRRELKSLLKNELDQKVLDLLAERYWNKPFNLKQNQNALVEPNLKELSQITNIDDDIYWHKKLDLTTSSLTKMGVGRISTSLVTNALLKEIENLVDNTQLKNHPMAKNAVSEAAKTVLGAKYYSTADQVENCIKPYKYEIEIEDREWQASKENSVRLLKEEIRQCDEVYNNLKKQIGGRKLQQVVSYLERLKQQQTTDVDFNSPEALGFSPSLIQRGQDAIFLKDRLSLLKMRYSFVKNSKKCKKKENKYQCPEIFLDAVASKVTSTSILFLNVELLSDFYYNFPRELDMKFFNNLSKEEIEKFAKEDPRIKKHIELQERKDLYENALSKIESVLAIQRTKTTGIVKNEKTGGSSIFNWGK